jgi:hypothetical protein
MNWKQALPAKKQAPAHVRVQPVFSLLPHHRFIHHPNTTLSPNTSIKLLRNLTLYQPHRTHFNMRFSLATLATVALATQTATADWLSGKGGKSLIKA